MERVIIAIMAMAFAALTGITIGDFVETSFNGLAGW